MPGAIAYAGGMNVERASFEPEETPEEAAEHDARMAAIAEKARRDPRFAHLFEPETDGQIAASLARAEADIAAGRIVPHEKVAEWLKTWGTPDFKPMPREWLE